jgi:hypothetical protein
MTVDSIPELRELLKRETTGKVEPQITAIADTALARYGKNASAILFYGSCLRRGYQDDDVVDLYLIVDRYLKGSASWMTALMNWMLPPNVVYLETDYLEKTIRAKCAIISLADFETGVSGRWFHSYMWARFAQPCRLAFVKDDDVTDRILCALQGAVKTMVVKTGPLMTSPFTDAALWNRALQETYRAELRAERPGRTSQLVSGDLDRYVNITNILCDAGVLKRDEEQDPSELLFSLSDATQGHWAARIKWSLRRILGKSLSVLRLMKAAFTFDDGAIYILWKIERHSGVSVELSEWQRRHPILASTVLFWRLYRRGAFK